jgi:hypothetical protein
MKQDKNDEGYISNKYLRELIIKFNHMNINDTGEWCDPYERKLENKKLKKTVTEDKYILAKSFIKRKREEIEELQNKYRNLGDEERRKFNAEFDALKAEICDAFLKVINGRIISFKLIQTPAYEDVEDIRQECMMTLFMYINRYDETRNSSAFAFVTQLITNAINLYLNEMNEHKDKEISGLDFYENLNTIDDPYGGDN